VRLLPAPLTIPQRLLLATTLASSTALFLAVGTLAFLDERQERAELVMRRTTDAEMIALHASSTILFDDAAAAEETLRVLHVKRDVERACIYTREGRLFAEFVARGEACAPESLPQEDDRARPRGLRVARPMSAGAETVGRVVIESDLEELDERRRRILGSGLVVSLFAFLAGLGLSWRYQRSLSRPLLDLARAAREVTGRQDYTVRVATQAPAELGALVESFNAMLDGIQERDRELPAGKAELEQRVRERTEELERELQVRREAEAEVRRLNDTLALRLEEVTSLNREIEAFSYSVSHDLRAPLRHVNGFVDLLRERAGPALDEKCQRYLQVIAKGASQMGCLIDDLLSFSRMSRAVLNQGDVRLRDLVAEVKQEVEREAGDRKVEWVLGDLPPVRGDRALLRVVFVNLLSNAVKYSSRRDKACIEVGCRSAENGLVVVFVRDNGVGFDMKYAGKLFGVFQRLHRPEDFEGTGIGLATVRRIVNRHGGEAWAQAEPGRGATFFVSLAHAEGS
jgi:signal transduction histidine kinase